MKGTQLERIVDGNSRNISVRKHFMFWLGDKETAVMMGCQLNELNRTLNMAEAELEKGGLIVHHEISARHVHFAVTDEGILCRSR